MTRRSYVEWRDCNNRFAETRWYHTDASTADALLAAIQNHSALGVQQRGDAPLVVVNQVPVGTPYASREFMALLAFCTAPGNVVELRLPGPNLNIFRGPPNGDAVDPAAINDIIVAAIGTLSDVAGNPVTSFNGGVLTTVRGLGAD